MKTKNNDKITVPHHVDDDDLVSYLDGELVRETHEEVRTHLESCWDCRRRLSSFERSIENFLELRQEKLLPPELPPWGPAVELFHERLAEHRALIETYSYFRLKKPDWRAFFRNMSRLLNFERSTSNSRLMMRVAAALLLMSLVGGLFFLSNKYTTVSASELLRHSINAQTEKVNATSQPVVHQRLQVKHKNTRSISVDATVTWEIWNDTTNARLQQAFYIQDKQESTLSGSSLALTNGLSSKQSSIPASLTEVEKIFQINHMDARRPLSAASYQSWSESIKSKTEEVTRLTQADGIEVLILRTVPTDPVNVGSITEAQFTVQASDWHPTKLYFRVKADEGENEYELIENDFEVVNLKDINPAIFSDEAKPKDGVALLPATTPKVVLSPSPSDSPETMPSTLAEIVAPPVPSAKMLTATNEAEVEVLELLHKIGADINEQLYVTRTANGLLMVEGIIETNKRKNEILQALSPIVKNPAITIKVQTIEEVARALAQQKRNTARQGSTSTVEVNKGVLPVDTDLREYFSKGGTNADEQIRKYASRMINHSQSALFQASAMNRLAGRFTTEQLKTLEPAAHAKWLNILKGYASAVRRDTVNLSGELQPVFGGPSARGESETITSDTDLINSAKRLYELAADIDRVIRSAFTLSSGNASVTAVKTPQFRRSLANAESLASAIERAP